MCVICISCKCISGCYAHSYCRMQCLSDPTHVLRNYLDGEGLVRLTVSPKDRHLYYKAFTHGILQPGILCIKPDRTVLYSWASEPNEVSNF